MTNTTLSLAVNSSIETYQWGAGLFYGVYGILCLFIFKQYCKYIYFRGYYPKNVKWHGAREGESRWTDFHNNDGPMDYMTRGAGECCIVMAYSLWYVLRLIIAVKSVAEGDSDISSHLHIGDEFLTIQIITWLMWTLTEAYYTWQGVEWEVIGPVHVFLCVVVLIFSVIAKIEYNTWMVNFQSNTI